MIEGIVSAVGVVLWQKELPEFSEIGAMVQAMMKATD